MSQLPRQSVSLEENERPKSPNYILSPPSLCKGKLCIIHAEQKEKTGTKGSQRAPLQLGSQGLDNSNKTNKPLAELQSTTNHTHYTTDTTESVPPSGVHLAHGLLHRGGGGLVLRRTVGPSGRGSTLKKTHRKSQKQHRRVLQPSPPLPTKKKSV